MAKFYNLLFKLCKTLMILMNEAANYLHGLLCLVSQESSFFYHQLKQIQVWKASDMEC